MDMKFFKCSHCGNIIAYVDPSGVDVICCGDEMVEMKPNTSDGAGEKHVPVISQDGDIVTVSVGSVTHPMQEKHYIQWIALQTEQGNQRKSLEPGEPPKACFRICDGDEVEAVYAYCNLHSLWKAE